MNADNVWLTTDEVAARLKIPKKTLAVWAANGRGPKFARMGRYRRYRLSDLHDWEQHRIDQHDRSGTPIESAPAANNQTTDR